MQASRTGGPCEERTYVAETGKNNLLLSNTAKYFSYGVMVLHTSIYKLYVKSTVWFEIMEYSSLICPTQCIKICQRPNKFMNSGISSLLSPKFCLLEDLLLTYTGRII